MKRIRIYLIWPFMLLALVGYGQNTPVDSTQLLKLQESTGKISAQLARNREKLAHLEKEYQEKTDSKQKAVAQAEASAQKNRNAAEELSDDSQNRAKARRAQRLASRARRDTKSVQRADKNLRSLEKNISKVKKQIEEEEKELNELQQRATPLVPGDTTTGSTSDSVP
ncbi:MAG: hypothetical protein JNK79_15690 [Chitinophagaceae bacterium]|nr:hypothetical protein [Chitinophagaceae bacterium]